MIILNFASTIFKTTFLMLKSFKTIAILEGISYLVLFSNMLFIKPSNHELYKTLLFPIGMTHGLLFIGYILLAVLLIKPQKWNIKRSVFILIASLLPFATFFVEKKYLKNV
jgi:integral membrane protein